jgi:DNA-binding XRE family transcriptional regulator
MRLPMLEKLIEERELAALAKKCREAADVSRAQAARDCAVARPTIFYAEEEPERGLHKLRKQIIERYSEYEVVGPVYLLRKKR